jgi:hypothetical protein
VVIPGGITSQLQVIDVVVKKTFQGSLETTVFWMALGRVPYSDMY